MSNTCDHLKEIADAVCGSYHLILAYYVTGIAEDASKRKACDAYCRLCRKNNRRLHACLECAFFGCFDSKTGKKSHMEEHYLEKSHCFAVNINHGCIFCFKCGDYIYNETFEDIFNEYKLETVKFFGYRPYMPWKPKADEIALLKDKIKKISDDSYIGLRGIINVGNSCYINVIIQVFIHNPILRDYFLLDQHKCFLKEKCLTCEMFVLFQEFYSGIKESYDASKRFFAALQGFAELKGISTFELGAEPQDAHELLQNILKELHDSCEKPSSKDTHDCNCLIHRTFYGVSQESRLCLKCGASSDLPLDHFMDILLDPESDEDSLVKLLNRKFLEPQFCSDHTCSSCNEKSHNLRQQIKKLPTVICIRLNRFDVVKQTMKKRTALAFEEWMDMSPYLKSRDHNMLPIENRYQLYAVIFYNGDGENGHYSVFVRQRLNKWYECDGSLVYRKTFKNVLECNPFLLFYCKQL